MNVCSRTRNVAAREIRANAGMLKKHSAQIVCTSLGPRPCAIATARTNAGNAITTSRSRMIVASRHPPR